MSSMFYDAEAFNQNLAPWDVANVTNYQHIFHDCPGMSGANSANRPIRFQQYPGGAKKSRRIRQKRSRKGRRTLKRGARRTRRR